MSKKPAYHHREPLRHIWRRVAAACMAAGALGAAAVPTAAEAQTASRPLRGEAATLEALPREAHRYMPRLARGRTVIVLSSNSFGDRPVTAANVQEIVARHMPADAVPLNSMQANLLAESVREDNPGAFRLTNSSGERIGCIIAMNGRIETPDYYAHMLTGIPREWMQGNLPGTGRQWHLAILFHEAAHCGQEGAPIDIFDPQRTQRVLSGEIDADQAMTDIFEDRLRGDYRQIAFTIRDMRALGALHISHPSHHTAAGVFMNAEERAWRGPIATGRDVAADMESIRRPLLIEVGQMLYARADWYLPALQAELGQILYAVPVTARATHPILTRRAEMVQVMTERGPQVFAETYGVSDPELVRAVHLRVGERMVREASDREAYAYFAYAAHRLLNSGAYAPDGFAARFLSMYVGAVNRHITTPACNATPVATTRAWYCRAVA